MQNIRDLKKKMMREPQPNGERLGSGLGLTKPGQNVVQHQWYSRGYCPRCIRWTHPSAREARQPPATRLSWNTVTLRRIRKSWLMFCTWHFLEVTNKHAQLQKKINDDDIKTSLTTVCGCCKHQHQYYFFFI